MCSKKYIVVIPFCHVAITVFEILTNVFFNILKINDLSFTIKIIDFHLFVPRQPQNLILFEEQGEQLPTLILSNILIRLLIYTKYWFTYLQLDRLFLRKNAFLLFNTFCFTSLFYTTTRNRDFFLSNQTPDLQIINNY